MAKLALKTAAAKVSAKLRKREILSVPSSAALRKAKPKSAPPKPVARKASAGKPRPRSAVLPALRRQEIVAAAVKLFSRRGFQATRAEDIAQSAKIAKGTLYLYFRSKEAIYSAAINHAVNEMQVLASERIGAAVDLRGKLTASITVRLHFWADHEALYRLLLTLGREARHRRQTNEFLKSGQAHFLAVFEEGVNTGELPSSDYRLLAWAVLDMIRGATERRMDHLHTRSVEGDAEAIALFALRSAGLTIRS